MFKNTIKKVFQKAFGDNIWKIEANGYREELGIEIRNKTTTIPTFHILRFVDGSLVMTHTPEEKEWTMEGIQKDFLILKKVGEQTPTKEGIKIVRISTGTTIFTSYEYTLLDLCEDYLHVRHRSFTSGGEQLMALTNGDLYPVNDHILQRYPKNRVTFPISYEGCPSFLAGFEVHQDLWISKISDTYLWCFHTKKAQGYDLHIAISDLERILDTVVVQTGLLKMFPQPYFQVGNQIFFMADNKLEIVSYLV